MKKKYIIPAVAIAITLVAYLLLRYTQQDTITIQKTVETLSSDTFNGRLLGTEGNDKTITYITEVFENLNLAKYDEDYYHESRQTIYPPDQQEHFMEVTYTDGSSHVYTYGEDYLEYPIPLADVSAKVTTDINDPDIASKILVLDKESKSKSYGVDATGVLLEYDSLFKLSSMLKLNAPKAAISPELYTQLTTKDVDQLTMKFKYEPKEIDAKSVVGKIIGEDSKKAVVLSAHFDHVGWAGDTIFRGTIDNASGTAILLELAKLLKDYSKKHTFKTDIIFAAFNGEDSFLFCSNDFVKDIENQYDSFYNINVDCIGKTDGGDITINGTYEDSPINTSLTEALLTCFTKNDLPILDEFYGASDHIHFNNKKHSGITLGQKDLMGENGGTMIHTKDDNLDHVDYDQMKKVAEIIFDFVITNNGTIYEPSSF